MLTVKLYVQWIKSVTAWADRDSYAISILGNVLYIRRCLILRLVKLETDLREVVEFWNGTAFDLGWNATL